MIQGSSPIQSNQGFIHEWFLCDSHPLSRYSLLCLEHLKRDSGPTFVNKGNSEKQSKTKSV